VLNQFVVLNARAVVRSIVLAGTVVLLLTFGGAIVASPALLLLLAWTARTSPSPRVGAVAAILSGLVGAEVAWAAAYVTVGEAGPWIVLVPVIAGILVVVAFRRWTRP
jgi:hypothetical protein